MKKTFRGLLSLVLTLALCASFSISVFAQSPVPESISQEAITQEISIDEIGTLSVATRSSSYGGYFDVYLEPGHGVVYYIPTPGRYYDIVANFWTGSDRYAIEVHDSYGMVMQRILSGNYAHVGDYSGYYGNGEVAVLIFNDGNYGASFTGNIFLYSH